MRVGCCHVQQLTAGVLGSGIQQSSFCTMRCPAASLPQLPVLTTSMKLPSGNTAHGAVLAYGKLSRSAVQLTLVLKCKSFQKPPGLCQEFLVRSLSIRRWPKNRHECATDHWSIVVLVDVCTVGSDAKGQGVCTAAL